MTWFLAGGADPEKLAVTLDDPKFNALSDVEKALAYVWWLTSMGRNRVIIHTGSSDMPRVSEGALWLEEERYDGRPGTA